MKKNNIFKTVRRGLLLVPMLWCGTGLYAQPNSSKELRVQEIEKELQNPQLLDDVVAHSRLKEELTAIKNPAAAKYQEPLMQMQGMTDSQIKYFFETQFQFIKAFTQEEVAGKSLPDATSWKDIVVGETKDKQPIIKRFYLVLSERLHLLVPIEKETKIESNH